MRIAMQCTELQHHRQVRVHGDAAENRHVLVARSIEAFAVHPLCRQHGARGQTVEDAGRKHHILQGRRSDAVHEPRGVPRFRPVIEFVHESSTPGVDRPDGIGVDAGEFLDESTDSSQQVHVQRDLFLDVRPLHLDGDLLSRFLQARLVHLSQRRGRHRSSTAAVVVVGHTTQIDDRIDGRHAPFLLQYFLGDDGIERRDSILEGLQPADIGRGEKIRAD
mmetsp:Transcript_15356/g.30612  ORF Transcript_15356/g.30612 Transcript_15356/m.30612 type:complete len:220 (-) Transcript_15356:876-1535(-)